MKEEELKAIIEGCIKNQPDDWKKLFTLAYPTIVKNIIETLNKHDFEKLYRGKGTRDHIFSKVMTVIQRKSHLLEPLVNRPFTVFSYLGETAKNETINFFRGRNVRDVSIKNEIEKQTDRLEDIINPNSEKTIQDNIGVDNIDMALKAKEQEQEVDEALEDIRNLTDRDRLVFKTMLMFYESLDQNDIAKIAEIRGVSKDHIENELAELSDSLIEKQENRIKEEAQINILWAMIKNLERKRYAVKMNAVVGSDEVEAVDAEIVEKMERLEELRLNKTTNMIRPSNGDIARLLALDIKNVNYVSSIIFRARDKLREFKGKRNRI